MANIKSQKKRNLTNAKRHERNKAIKAELRTRIKTAIETGDEESLRAAVKRIDMAASKGVIHKNSAARMKSRMAHAVNIDA
jgi:small subunit ribosomal protein S20